MIAQVTLWENKKLIPFKDKNKQILLLFELQDNWCSSYWDPMIKYYCCVVSLLTIILLLVTKKEPFRLFFWTTVISGYHCQKEKNNNNFRLSEKETRFEFTNLLVTESFTLSHLNFQQVQIIIKSGIFAPLWNLIDKLSTKKRHLRDHQSEGSVLAKADLKKARFNYKRRLYGKKK